MGQNLLVISSNQLEHAKSSPPHPIRTNPSIFFKSNDEDQTEQRIGREDDDDDDERDSRRDFPVLQLSFPNLNSFLSLPSIHPSACSGHPLPASAPCISPRDSSRRRKFAFSGPDEGTLFPGLVERKTSSVKPFVDEKIKKFQSSNHIFSSLFPSFELFLNLCIPGDGES